MYDIVTILLRLLLGYMWICTHQLKDFAGLQDIQMMPSCFPDTWSKHSHLQAHPVPDSSSDKKSMPSSLVSFSVSASPSFILKRLYINASCHVWPTSAEHSGCHTWVRDGGLGEDGRSECKQSLSLHCHWGRDALCVCVRLRPQDKNVFDIACNCVMFTLLVSEGTCISKQAFDCRCWWGEAFLWASSERQQEV